MHNLGMHPVRLSDGSMAYNVSIGSETFHCVTEKDALAFIETINHAIAHNTNDEARIVYHETTLG